MKMCKPNELNEIMDTIFVFTKSMGLESMMQDIKHLIGAKDTANSLFIENQTRSFKNIGKIP